jgi:hypothetical protein
MFTLREQMVILNIFPFCYPVVNNIDWELYQ